MDDQLGVLGRRGLDQEGAAGGLGVALDRQHADRAARLDGPVVGHRAADAAMT